MRHSLRAALLVALGLARPIAAEPLPLPPADQFKVNEAILKGVSYLRTTQRLNGTWAEKDDHAVGYAALPGLTLLQCGVRGGDSAVQRAVSFVVYKSSELESTYDLALAILFLDQSVALDDRVLERAQAAHDVRVVIETLALRLMAGQKADGGWLYSCPRLRTKEHKQLWTALKEKQPNLKKLVESVRKMPVLKDPAKLIKDVKKNPPAENATPSDQSDNSNTNFAVLALWVAQRHGVPVERSLKLAARRFRNSQNADGGWGYKYRHGGGEAESAPMICSGLVALAVDQGVEDANGRRAARQTAALRQTAAAIGFPDLVSQFLMARALDRAEAAETAARKRLDDPVVRKAFEALDKHVGMPAGRMDKIDLGNLYYLWALERAAILYDVGKIGDKDWYRWGAEMIVANQKEDGRWEKKDAYPGASPTIDSCFALLFLKQANLAEDLTAKLRAGAQKVAEKPRPAEGVKPPKPVVARPPAPAAPAAGQDKAAARSEPDRTAALAPAGAASLPSAISSQPDNTSGPRLNGLLLWGGAGVVLLLVAGAAVLVFLGLQDHRQSTVPEEKVRRVRSDPGSRRDYGVARKRAAPRSKGPNRSSQPD
jgi:hypothetical protein